MSAKRKPWFPMDYGYTEDPLIVETLLTYGHKAFVLWSVLIDVLYQRGGTLTVKPYVVLELEDRTKLSNHEVQTLLNGLVKVGLINYDKANEKITSDRVSKELNLRANFSEEGRKNASKRWKSGQDQKTEGTQESTHKATLETPAQMGPQMGSHITPHITPHMLSKDSKDSNVLTGLKKAHGDGPAPNGPSVLQKKNGFIVSNDYPHWYKGEPVNFTSGRPSFAYFRDEVYPGEVGEDSWRVWEKMNTKDRRGACDLMDKFIEQFELTTSVEYLQEKFWLNVQQ